MLDCIVGLVLGSFSGVEVLDVVLVDYLVLLCCLVLVGWLLGYG